MKSKDDLKKLQDQMGYTFKEISYLKQALIHSSYANENKLSKVENNERLEFLGDAVLEVVTSSFLFVHFPEMLEGELTKKRASIVCEPTLAKLCVDLNLGEYLLLGKGEEGTGGRSRASILSDALEAIIGGIFLDSGLDAAYEFISKNLLESFDKKTLFVDSKTHLQELIQSISDKPIEYQVISESGPDHNKSFEIQVKHDNKPIGFGLGRSKKSAEQEAALDAIKNMKVE